MQKTYKLIMVSLLALTSVSITSCNGGSTAPSTVSNPVNSAQITLVSPLLTNSKTYNVFATDTNHAVILGTKFSCNDFTGKGCTINLSGYATDGDITFYVYDGNQLIAAGNYPVEDIVNGFTKIEWLSGLLG